MALDERDYMRERARQMVKRNYYGEEPGSKARPARGTHWTLILVFWLAVANLLWLAYSLAA